MEWKISKQFENTIAITIWDDEINSSDKEAFLDLILNKHRNKMDSWGSRHINSDNVVYLIHKTIWDNKEFQKNYMLLSLSL
jgi:hypothetical protein